MKIKILIWYMPSVVVVIVCLLTILIQDLRRRLQIIVICKRWGWEDVMRGKGSERTLGCRPFVAVTMLSITGDRRRHINLKKDPVDRTSRLYLCGLNISLVTVFHLAAIQSVLLFSYATSEICFVLLKNVKR